MKRIVTLDKANQPFGFVQLDASGTISNSIIPGSFATTGSNIFIGNQIVTGSLTTTGAITADTEYLAGRLYFGTSSQNISTGSFDNGTGGENGISINCAVGYEFNWQGGKLEARQSGGTVPIDLKSPLKIADGTQAVGKVLTSDANGVMSLQTPAGGGNLSYSVFTALLTQSGGDNFENASDDPLEIGVTYLITNNSDGTADFTNLGAPNNNVGTYFISTGTTPNSWGTEFAGNLSYNHGAPKPIILENTIGNIWFIFIGDGLYRLYTSSPLPLDKTFATIVNNSANETSLARYGVTIDGGGAVIITFDNTLSDQNNQLLNTPIEIRVYN